MNNIIHISDLHIGSGDNIYRSFVLFNRIIEHYELSEEPPIVLITGDIVDSGQQWQFQEAHYLLNVFYTQDWPVILVPGNHDYGFKGIIIKRWNRALFHKYLPVNHSKYPCVHIFDTCTIIVLDSLAGELGSYWADGKIGFWQRYRLNHFLDQTDLTKPIFIALHHHPFYYAQLRALKDHAKLKHILAYRVQGLLFGHKHREQQLEEEESEYGIPLIYASGKSTDIHVGVNNYEDQPVFRFAEISVPECRIEIVEVPVMN